MTNNYPKDSFDRFGDDLSGVLLSQLSLDLKICFECVSKQWARLVFAGHHSLSIVRHRMCQPKWSQLFVRLYAHQIQTFVLNPQLLRSLLKKLNQLKHLVIHKKCLVDDSVLEVLADLFDNEILSGIKTLDIRLKDDINDQLLHRFCRSFGQSLTRVSFTGLSPNMLATVLPDFGHNLRSIDFKHNLSALLMCSDDQSDPLLPKLDTISVTNPSTDALKLMARLYGRQLKQLSLSFDLHFEHNIENTVKFVSYLPELEILRLSLKMSYYEEENHFNGNQLIDKSLELIGQRCRRLHTLHISLWDNIISDEFVKIFGHHFQCLSRLDLFLWDTHDKQIPCSVNPFGFDPQNGQHLRRLYLGFNGLSDGHLKDIHQFMPNLTAITLYSDQRLTDECLSHLSKLRHLRTLVLDGNIDMKYLTVDGIVEFITNTPTIQLLDIEFVNDLNEGNYDAFKVLAKMRPQIDFYIRFHGPEDLCVYVNTKNNLHVYKMTLIRFE